MGLCQFEQFGLDYFDTMLRASAACAVRPLISKQYDSFKPLSPGSFGWRKDRCRVRASLQEFQAPVLEIFNRENRRSVEHHQAQVVVVEERWQPEMVQQDLGVTVAVLAGAWAWVRLFDYLTKQEILDQKLSRKLVHITSGLIFVLCWPLYSTLPWAPYLAAVVPLCNGIRLLVYGLGLLRDEGLVKSVSRQGDPKELLRGPLYYVIVLVFSTVLFWRDSPVGVVALAMMCGGDGIADIVGRRFGSSKLPWNSGKSWAGSIAMFLFGLLVSYGCLCYFAAMGFYQLDNLGTVLRLAVVSMAATIVESLPVSTKLDDNVTVPLTTVVAGLLLFPPAGSGRILGLM